MGDSHKMGLDDYAVHPNLSRLFCTINSEFRDPNAGFQNDRA